MQWQRSETRSNSYLKESRSNVIIGDIKNRDVKQRTVVIYYNEINHINFAETHATITSYTSFPNTGLHCYRYDCNGNFCDFFRALLG